ncbi:MAG: family transcriptional regulator [Actinomycetia bacterium]|nr:family transcriptional regulator [Actinomycetes bacterium]
MDHDPVLDAVGQRLRTLRQQHQLSLSALSAMTGISTSTLSRLESGGRKPTLELLLALARAYEVPLDDLVGAPPAGDPRVRLQPFRRHDRTLIPLTQRTSGPRAYKMIIPPAGPNGDTEQKVHEGYEWMYVLSGLLRLRLAEHDFVMKAGEVAEFDTRVPHWFGSAAPEPAEVLVLFGPQGERMHVRARPKTNDLPECRSVDQLAVRAACSTRVTTALPVPRSWPRRGSAGPAPGEAGSGSRPCHPRAGRWPGPRACSGPAPAPCTSSTPTTRSSTAT